MVHDLKIKDSYLCDVISGIKRFEFRVNDRNFEVGDTIRLHPLSDPETYFSFEIIYLLPLSDVYSFMSNQYVILGISECIGFVKTLRWIDISKRLLNKE